MAGEPKQPAEPVIKEDVKRSIVPETVDALLDITWKLLDDESRREGTLHVRGVAVVGFAGVVAGLTTTLAKAALEPRLPPGWRAASLGLFCLAIASLAAVAVFTLLKVLLPRGRPTLALSEVDRFLTWRAIVQPVELEQGRAMVGLRDVLAQTRAKHDTMARALQKAYVGLVIGLLAASGLSLILGLRYVGAVELSSGSEAQSQAEPGRPTVRAPRP